MDISTKRVFDVLISAASLVALSPLLLTLAILVKLDSPGPALYRGRRTGKHGDEFNILKFRSMVVDAEKRGGYSTALNDPRITRLGKILRRYKLDEFPQLINVLRGEMSIVGPRPEVPAYTRMYSGEEMLILTVRPGITDYASIKFSRLDLILGERDADRAYDERVKPEKNALRIKYVKEQKFITDLIIIGRTIVKLTGSGIGIR
jgi:lipopolysaccharide/colanic/teichoic acid biosynthesis glycosyltransferase